MTIAEELEMDEMTVGELLKQTARTEALLAAYVELKEAEQAGKTAAEILEMFKKIIEASRNN